MTNPAKATTPDQTASEQRLVPHAQQGIRPRSRAARLYASAGSLERMRYLPRGMRSEHANASVTPMGLELFKRETVRSWSLNGALLPILDAENPNMIVAGLGGGGRVQLAPNMAITPYLSMAFMGGVGGPSTPFFISRLSTGIAAGKGSRRLDGAVSAYQLIDLNSYDNPETETQNGHAELHVVAIEVGYWF